MTQPAAHLALVLFLIPFTTSFAQVHPAPAKGIPDHLVLKNDAAAALKFGRGFVPAPFLRTAGEKGPIAAGPFRCSRCADEAGFAKDAKLPPKLERLGKRPASDVTSWWENEHKLKPIVITLEHAVMLIDLPPAPVRGLPSDERAYLEQFFGKLKDREPVTPHQRAHLFAHRYMKSEAAWIDLMCLNRSAPDFVGPVPSGHFGSKGRSEIFIFPNENSYREFGRHFFSGFGQWTTFWFHPDTESVVASLNGGVADHILAARFEHQIAHSLLYQYRLYIHDIPVWVTEGLGHFFERRHAVFENTYCILGSDPAWIFEEPDWWRFLKDLVAKGQDLPLSQLSLITKLGDLRPPLHPQAWSMVSYMIGLGPARFRRFFDVLKTKLPAESLPECQYRAIQTAYETDTATFQRAWRAWVTTTRSVPLRER